MVRDMDGHNRNPAWTMRGGSCEQHPASSWEIRSRIGGSSLPSTSFLPPPSDWEESFCSKSEQCLFCPCDAVFAVPDSGIWNLIGVFVGGCRVSKYNQDPACLYDGECTEVSADSTTELSRPVKFQIPVSHSTLPITCLILRTTLQITWQCLQNVWLPCKTFLQILYRILHSLDPKSNVWAFWRIFFSSSFRSLYQHGRIS